MYTTKSPEERPFDLQTFVANYKETGNTSNVSNATRGPGALVDFLLARAAERLRANGVEPSGTLSRALGERSLLITVAAFPSSSHVLDGEAPTPMVNASHVAQLELSGDTLKLSYQAPGDKGKDPIYASLSFTAHNQPGGGRVWVPASVWGLSRTSDGSAWSGPVEIALLDAESDRTPGYNGSAGEVLQAPLPATCYAMHLGAFAMGRKPSTSGPLHYMTTVTPAHLPPL